MSRITKLGQLNKRKLGDPIKLGREVRPTVGGLEMRPISKSDMGGIHDRRLIETARRAEDAGLTWHLDHLEWTIQEQEEQIADLNTLIEKLSRELTETSALRPAPKEAEVGEEIRQGLQVVRMSDGARAAVQKMCTCCVGDPGQVVVLCGDVFGQTVGELCQNWAYDNGGWVSREDWRPTAGTVFGSLRLLPPKVR